MKFIGLFNLFFVLSKASQSSCLLTGVQLAHEDDQGRQRTVMPQIHGQPLALADRLHGLEALLEHGLQREPGHAVDGAAGQDPDRRPLAEGAEHASALKVPYRLLLQTRTLLVLEPLAELECGRVGAHIVDLPLL